MKCGIVSSLLIVAAASLPPVTLANDYAEAITQHANTVVKSWLSDPIIIEAVKAQNTANANLTQADIDRLDKQWRAEVGASSKPTVDSVVSNTLSGFLKTKQASSNGLYTEIFIMDNRGLNVGQSDITSDYWQGDEPKWQDTYAKGADSIHISEVEEDESTQIYQSQLSLPVLDPASQQPIGAITIGINVEGL
jgi:hypothetical protein